MLKVSSKRQPTRKPENKQRAHARRYRRLSAPYRSATILHAWARVWWLQFHCSPISSGRLQRVLSDGAWTKWVLPACLDSFKCLAQSSYLCFSWTCRGNINNRVVIYVLLWPRMLSSANEYGFASPEYQLRVVEHSQTSPMAGISCFLAGFCRYPDQSMHVMVDRLSNVSFSVRWNAVTANGLSHLAGRRACGLYRFTKSSSSEGDLNVLAPSVTDSS